MHDYQVDKIVKAINDSNDNEFLVEEIKQLTKATREQTMMQAAMIAAMIMLKMTELELTHPGNTITNTLNDVSRAFTDKADRIRKEIE